MATRDSSAIKRARTAAIRPDRPGAETNAEPDASTRARKPAWRPGRPGAGAETYEASLSASSSKPAALSAPVTGLTTPGPESAPEESESDARA